MALPILLVHGFSDDDLYTENIKASKIYGNRGTNVVIIDFKNGIESQCEAIAEKILSKHYPAVIISDLTDKRHFEQFIAHVGPALVKFAEQGGRVAFPTSEGISSLHVIKTLFSVPWEGVPFCSSKWRVPEGRESIVDTVFPLKHLHSERNPASELEFSVKAVPYKNVPPNEQFFGNTGADHSKSGSLSSPLFGVASSEHNEMWMYSVAVRSVGQGSVAFFGDVDAEPVTCDLIAAYCLA